MEQTWEKRSRRKKLDANWGQSQQVDQPEKPKITYLSEEHPDYEKACAVRETFYADKERVYLVRVDYSDGDYFVGAVHTFLVGTEITVNAVWAANSSTERTGAEILKSIRRDIGLKAKDEWYAY